MLSLKYFDLIDVNVTVADAAALDPSVAPPASVAIWSVVFVAFTVFPSVADTIVVVVVGLAVTVDKL